MDESGLITIRPCVISDGPEMWPLLQDMGYIDSEAGVRQRLTALSLREDHYIPVAAVETLIVGYAWVQDYGPHLRSGARTARLNDLYVLPAWRRHGAGRRLFAAVRAWAQARGVRWLQWQASRAAIPFYERLGFQGDTVGDLPEHPFFEIDFGAG
ncbi:MAG: N-acetyltransferase [Chloroflexi bacterium]|nr:N-acetyltransferase [Chloroflexota bacterium]